MEGINVGRLLGGGVVAALVLIVNQLLFGLLVGEAIGSALQDLGASSVGASAVVGMALQNLVAGFLISWIYVAIRPHYRRRIAAALSAGLVVWFMGWFWALAQSVFVGVLPGDAAVVGMLLGVLFVPGAAWGGALLYKED